MATLIVIICFVPVVFSISSNDEKTIQSLIDMNSKLEYLERIVHGLQKENKELKSNSYKLSENIQDLKSENRNLKSRLSKLEDIMTSIPGDAEGEHGNAVNMSTPRRSVLVPSRQNAQPFNRMTKQIQQSKIAFYAMLSQDQTIIGHDQTIRFDNALVNAGGAYDPQDGIFIAPVSGVYVFFFCGMVNANRYIELVLSTSNSVFNGGIHAQPASNAWNSGSTMAILQLNAGTHVWVKKNLDDGNYLHAFYSSFSGFLLYGNE